MLIKQLLEHLQTLDPNDQIAVIYYTQDEFDGNDGEHIDSATWDQAVKDFEECDDIDASVTAYLKDQINFLIGAK